MLAARNSEELNLSDVSKESEIPTTSLNRMLDLLETMYLIQRIPAWSTNLTKRAVSRPKASSSIPVSRPDSSTFRRQEPDRTSTARSQAICWRVRHRGDTPPTGVGRGNFPDEPLRDRAAGEVDVILETRTAA